MTVKHSMADILNAVGETLIVTDVHGVIETVNDAAAALLKVPKEQMLGCSIQDFFPYEDPLFQQQGMELIRRSGTVSNIEKEFKDSQGNLIPILVNCSGLTDVTGELVAVVCVAVDLTERRVTERELLRAFEEKTVAQTTAKAKGEFMGNITHELRTPLNAIIGYAEILEEELEAEDLSDLVGDVQKIRTAGTKLLGLINDVLDLNQAQSGGMEVQIEEFRVQDLLDELMTEVTPMAEKQQNTLQVSVEEVQTIHSDYQKVKHMLMHVLSNACKFCHEGDVTVRVGYCECDCKDVVCITVRDTGIGMTPDQIEKVFNQFTQADNSSTRPYDGPGLGLAISRQMSRALKGKILVDSAINEWTEVTIVLPVR